MKIEIEKSEYDRLKSREEKLLAYYGWFVDKENDLATVEDIVTENIKLKSDLSLVIKERDDNIKVNEFFKKTNSELWNVIEWLKEENRNLKSELSKFSESFKKYRDYEKEELAESCYDLTRENKKLKERIKELEQCNLNLQTWLDNKEKVNKSLREENKRLSDFLECES